MILIHSWLGSSESEQEMKSMMEGFNVPVICLRRDCRNLDLRDSLSKKCIHEELPQEICNVSIKDNISQDLNTLKRQVFMFI